MSKNRIYGEFCDRLLDLYSSRDELSRAHIIDKCRDELKEILFREDNISSVEITKWYHSLSSKVKEDVKGKTFKELKKIFIDKKGEIW